MILTPEELETIENISLAKLSQAFSEDNPHYTIFKKVIENTKFIDDAYPTAKIGFSLRLNCVKNNITSIPMCKACGKPTGIKKDYSDKFTMYCSDDCRKTNNGNLLSVQTYEMLNDYDWLFEHRITKRLSYGDIGKILGCSGRIVSAYAAKLNLNKERYNESQPFAKAKLRDKDWLYEQHVVNHRTLDSIAEEIGSSKATISVWLENHGIIANKSNSYDRASGKASTEEFEIAEYILSLGFNVAMGNRTILDGFEIDIVVEEKKLGIEHHGLHSHWYNPNEVAYAKRKDSTYHKMKYQLATDKGYRLIQVFGDQWKTQTDIVKSIISSKLGVTEKIYARKCKIVSDVKNGIKDTFMDDNHIQGKDTSSIRLGLEYDGEIVAMMTFHKDGRNRKENYDWELSRYCSKKFITVVGGFSKLLKYFREHYIGSIISYSDCMWSIGEVYEKNGFEFQHDSLASYYYVPPKEYIRERRENYVKKKITFKDDPRSEETIMFERGYKKIFDAGTKSWVLR